MFNWSKTGTRSSVLFCIVVLAVITVLTVLPYKFGSQATSSQGLLQRTVSQDEGIPRMWDIREAKGEGYADALESFRTSNGKNAAAVADLRESFVRGEGQLKQRLPNARIEYNTDIRIPEVITPDVYRTRLDWLSSPSKERRADILRNFAKDNAELVGMRAAQIDALKTTADYTNPDGNLSFAML